MKNLIITLSFFLLLPLTGHANGLMKFKKVKAGEVAPKIQNRVPLQYVVEMRKVIVGFMIKLEEDTASGKISRSSSSSILHILRSQLLIADAYAKMAKDEECFAGGWKSKINSAGTCIIPASVNSPECGAAKMKCDPALFGSPTCVSKAGPRGQGFTARCEDAVKGDNEKLAQIHAGLSKDSNTLTELSKKIKGFCDKWKSSNNQREYDGCSNLENQVARIQRIKTLSPSTPEITVGGPIDPIGIEPLVNPDPLPQLPALPEVSEVHQPIAEPSPIVEQQQPVQPVRTPAAASGAAGDLRIRNGGSPQPSENESNLFCKPESQIFPQSCVSLLNTFNEAAHVKVNRHPSELGAEGGAQTEATYVAFKPIDPSKPINFENPSMMASFLAGQQSLAQVGSVEDSITPLKACQLLASGCPTENVTEAAYRKCITSVEGDKNRNAKRVISIGFQKTIAISKAAEATTKYEEGDDYGGNPITCKGNKSNRNTEGGFAFDYPRCKAFVNWFTVLSASEVGFKVGNEAAVTTAGMRNQTRLSQEIEAGNGQDAGFEAARLQAVEAKKAEERNMGFFSAKAAAIGVQLAQWVGPGNVCDHLCCKLFDTQGADRIKTSFFPNQDGKQHIIAQLVKAGADIAVAKLKADMHAQNARKVQAIKEQMQFTDESDEGVMKFCVEFPQDVRCLSPGQRRALGASGTQFGSFQGSNFGLGSLEGEQASDINAGQDFGGSLAAGGPSGNVGNIGNADKDAAAAKNIFNAPAPARGGGGGGAGAGAGGGGGGGGSAQAGQLSRDEGLKEDKKESPIEITGKRAAYEGSKGGYNGGGYNPSNKKPGESPTANPFAGMFGKDQGRDPANVAEIDKPASDLFTKISRRYGEVQKRKALLEVADEGSGIR